MKINAVQPFILHIPVTGGRIEAAAVRRCGMTKCRTPHVGDMSQVHVHLA